MANIVTFGEIMLRLSPPGFERIVSASSFDVRFGGCESNVAASLAIYGHNAEFVTRVPDNLIGDAAVSFLRKLNVGTEHIIKGGERLGIYFLENGASLRPSGVIYDRANSAIATAAPEEFDFDEILKNADMFLFSGITSAVVDGEIIKKALKSAKKLDVTVVCDYNYRQKLWTRERAAETISEYMPYTDIFFGGIDDALNLLGRNKSENDSRETIFGELAGKFSLKYVFATNRESKSASDNTISAYAYSSDDKKLYSSESYGISPIVDRVGGGDAFTAGALCGILDGKTASEAIEFGIAASALKHTIPGDINTVSRAEVERLSSGDGSGRVQR